MLKLADGNLLTSPCKRQQSAALGSNERWLKASKTKSDHRARVCSTDLAGTISIMACLRQDCVHNTLKLLSGTNWTDVTEICVKNAAVSSVERSLRSQVYLEIKYHIITNSSANLV